MTAAPARPPIPAARRPGVRATPGVRTGPRVRASGVPKLPGLLAAARREGWHNWIRGDGDEAAVLNGCHFLAAAAERVAEFFARFLRHSKGQFAGKAFELLDWQRDDLFYPLFGWQRSEAQGGGRRYRIAYVEIPKKNGKSTIASGVGLYLLCGDGEMGAEVYSAATDKAQAGIVHNEAINMVNASPALSRSLRVNLTTHNIAFPAAGSFYRALSAEADNKEGLNAHGLICDELHVWPGRALWDCLLYAGAARRQPLLFSITTAGDDLTSVCREQHDYVRDLEKGTRRDERYFGYIRAAGEKDDVRDPATWAKANPSLGVTINPVDFKADMEKAHASPSALATFKRYRLNIWSTSTNPWLDLDAWERAADDYDAAELEGRGGVAGLDLAKVADMSALVLLSGNEADAGGIRMLPFFWLPEATALDPRNVNGPMYRDWAAAGHLKLTSGNTVDYETIEADVLALKQRFLINDLAYDAMYAGQIAQRFQDHHGLTVHEFPQTLMHFAAPTARFEKLLLAGRIRHNRNPVLTWQAGNVTVYRDRNGNMRPVKPEGKSPKKIDGMVAAIMALGRMLDGEPKQSRDTGRVVFV